jgi:hypothetical protein
MSPDVSSRSFVRSAIDCEIRGFTDRAPCGAHSLLIFEEEGKPIALNGVVQDAGDRMRNPGWVLVRPDQVVAARGAGTDFSALLVYAAQVRCPRPDA